MPTPELTPIRIDEDDNETHPSWLLIRANRISSTGTRLFDSEIKHQHYIRVTVSRCTRKRDLHRDWLHSTQILIEVDMSEAQWGAFVSSFGNGSGVPATLSTLMGKQVPGTPVDSRLNQSHEDVKNAASKAVEEVKQAHAAVAEAFNENMGKKVMRDRMNMLNSRIQNLPANMEYASKSLSEHVENVVTKARGDIEAMAVRAMEQNAISGVGQAFSAPLTLGSSWSENFGKEETPSFTAVEWFKIPGRGTIATVQLDQPYPEGGYSLLNKTVLIDGKSYRVTGIEHQGDRKFVGLVVRALDN